MNFAQRPSPYAGMGQGPVIAPARTNAANDGTGFQGEIETTALGYARAGIAILKKVDPPVRVVGGGAQRRIIFLPNPFLDYVGSWTAHHGRALFIEAKSTQDHRLRFNGDGGFTKTQWAAMRSWRSARAACALVWQWRGDVCLFTPEMLREQEKTYAKSLLFTDGIAVLRGKSLIVWDFLAALEWAIWGEKKAQESALQVGNKSA